MKTDLFKIMQSILADHLPQTICEIGTHKARSASQMINFLSTKVKKLHYTGYDVFDFAIDNLEFNRNERNGKNGAAYAEAAERLDELCNQYKNFTYELHKGFTTDTLVKPKAFDFVYIDGGHSYESVKHDYSMVKDSKVIMFDDVQIAGVRQFIDELISSGIEVELIDTPLKHIWAKIVN
jgi:hypothetical protein